VESKEDNNKTLDLRGQERWLLGVSQRSWPRRSSVLLLSSLLSTVLTPFQRFLKDVPGTVVSYRYVL